MKRKTQEEIIKKCKEVHGNKYDYSKVEYKNIRTKVCIICPEHGEFKQTLANHIWAKHDCPQCAKKKYYDKRSSSTEEFIKRSKEVHGDKYDYSKVEYVGALTKVCIICPEHGEFEQLPSSHLKGIGCSECGKIKKSISKTLTTEEFIKRSKEVHGDKYDYSKVDYKNMKSNVVIICPKHGEFEQNTHTHLCGHGCPKCSISQLEKSILNLLTNNNIKFIYQHKFDWLKDKNHLPIDFYLPDYNVVIECQGLQHFKPSNFGSKKLTKEYLFNKTLKHDKLKYQLCKENGIDIIYFSNLNIQYPYKVLEDENELLNEIKKYKI